MATFNYLSVLIAYAGYKFFKVILLKKQLLGKTTLQQELWLQQQSASDKSDVQMSCQEMLGVSLIIGFNAVIMLSIINDDKAYLPPTAKHKEKFLRENGGQGLLCKDCRQMEKAMRNSESNKYDERLSQKYGQRILRADLDMRGSIGQFNNDGASALMRQRTASARGADSFTDLRLQDDEREKLLGDR